MKTRPLLVTASLLVLGLGGLWWFGMRPHQSADGQIAVDDIDSPSRFVQIPDEEPSHVSNRPGFNGLRLGGIGLNLQQVYRGELATRGSDDTLLAAFVDFGRVICSNEYAEDNKGWKDPDRKWAMEYIQAACSGFDTSDYVYTGTSKNALWYRANVGDKEAAEAALRDLYRSDNMLEVGVASMYLIQRDLFPEQADYDLPKEDLIRIGIMAGKLRTCGAMDACGAYSLITADICARVGCKPGTPFAEAIRRDLSPREYEAVLKMRDTMARL